MTGTADAVEPTAGTAGFGAEIESPATSLVKPVRSMGGHYYDARCRAICGQDLGCLVVGPKTSRRYTRQQGPHPVVAVPPARVRETHQVSGLGLGGR